MARVVIKGGLVVDPAAKMQRVADVILEDERVVGITASGAKYVGAKIIDAVGMVVTPGFIDLHTHLRQPGGEAKETIASGTAAAARGGFTTVCAMPNTNPTIDNVQVLRDLQESIKADAKVRVEAIASITKGLDSSELTDMYALAEAGAVAFSNDGLPVSDSMVMRNALSLAADMGLPVINHAEDPNLVGRGVMNEGEVALRLGLVGVPAQSEAIMVARDIQLAALTGARVHIPHVSTREAVELIADAKKRGAGITAEVTPHHLCLTDAWVAARYGKRRGALDEGAYDTNARVNPPLRTARDTEALVKALAAGDIDVVATDHAPHAKPDKETTFEEAAPGISGLETAFGLLNGLVIGRRLPYVKLVERLTAAPAKIIGKEEYGTLKPGSYADVAILDTKAKWTVQTDKFLSKGKNTPLEGYEMTGKVLTTIYKGEVVYNAWDEVGERGR